MAASKAKNNAKRKSSIRVPKKRRGISKFQALAIASVLAVTGVVAVVASHASGTPDYQYSWNKYCVSAYGKDTDKEVKDCKNRSAEAIVFRLYRGLFDRSPNSEEYKFWTQKFAGDRMKVSGSDLVVRHSAKLGNSDTAFVKAVYRNMLDREATDKEMVAWRTKIKEKKLTRAQLVTQFAVSSEAITKNQATIGNREGFDAYIARVPKVNVEQTAAAAQKARFNSLYVDYQQPNNADMNKAASIVVQAQSELAAASATASKKTPTANDLKAIAANQSKTQGYYTRVKAIADGTARRASLAQQVYNRSENLADFATDIGGNSVYGIRQIGKRNTASKNYSNATVGKVAVIKRKIDAIAAQYKVAEKKYQDELRRQEKLREEAEKKNTNRNTNNDNSDDNPAPSSTQPAPSAGTQPNSGKTEHACPNGFFKERYVCWNGVVGKYVGASASCPSGMQFYQSYTTREGLKKKDCRTTKPSGSYWY